MGKQYHILTRNDRLEALAMDSVQHFLGPRNNHAVEAAGYRPWSITGAKAVRSSANLLAQRSLHGILQGLRMGMSVISRKSGKTANGAVFAAAHWRTELAVRLGMTANALNVALSRLRRRYGELVREEVAQTVADPADVGEELRCLAAAIRG